MSLSTSHPRLAAEFIKDEDRARWHNQTLWMLRAKRDRAAQTLPEWEDLRERASQLKLYTMSHLDELLLQFERQATAHGATVHWAADADEHNRIVLSLLQKKQVRKLAKSKSMLTEECHLNPYLEKHGIEVVDTDLGEWIVQLRQEPPSHIVAPAIHLKREEIGELFHQKIGTEKGATDPQYLTESARTALRNVFLTADAGLTGGNFLIAETGGVVVCTNEGNADLGVSLPRLQIASVGIEKLIPRARDLGVFLRLLARSATGQPITVYSSHFHGPRTPDSEFHIVLVDNGRSRLLGDHDFRRSLNCIRCGACLNTCPVYRRSGGYSYNATLSGPIGSILSPARDLEQHHSLPYACSLCGSCSDVCPVKINLHEQLYTFRQRVAARGLLPPMKSVGMKLGRIVLGNEHLYRLAGKFARFALRLTPRAILSHRWNPWGRQRDLPPPPKQSFREQYRSRS